MAAKLESIIDLLADYSLSNPDTLTKYKEAAKISHKVLEAVSGTRSPPLPTTT
jgi:methionine aminopeptidase